MSTKSGSWYIPGEGKKPVGPFTGEQVIESLRAGRLTERTLCWQEGMAKWLPLAEVEPFAASIRPVAAPRKGGLFRRLVIRSVLLAGIAALGVVLYVYWQEATVIGKAKSLIAAGDCEEAAELLRSFQQDTYLYRYSHEPGYLLALSATRQYALAADPKGLPEEPLEKPRRRFKDLFSADERWREQAKVDLAGVIAVIPRKAPDDLARAVIFAGFLQELKVAEGKQLAKELLVRFKTRVDAGRTPEDGDAPVVACILRLDPSLAAAVVAAALSDSEEWPQQVRTRLAPVQHWAREPPLAQLLAAALLQRGTDLAGSGKREAAGHLLDAAEAVSPELREQCARKRIEWIKKDLGEKDYSGAFSALYGMHTDNYSTGVCAEIASLLLEVAQQLAKKSPAIAERAVDKAFQLQPSLGDSEANVVLWITVHQEPNSEKLRQCQRFLSTFSKSEQYGDVQMQIIGDAIAFARSGAGRIANREMDTAYCDAACAMAAALLEKNPPPKELNPQAWTLAECLADVGQHGKAVQTAELFLKAFPDTPLKKEIEGKLPDWRNLPKIGLYVPIPGRGQGHDTLEAKLLRRKRTIDTSTAVYDAVANKEIWIIEVADACTADQFNAEQTRLLRNWVSEGGVLWVNSNVLDLFGVRHSRGSDASFAHCIPAGPHPILEGVNLTLLDELKDKALTLSYRGVIPLLAVKQEGRNEYFEPPAGTTAWSLVPFGKGWISDPKPLGLNEGRLSPWALGHDPGQNALFWGRFCQFCLHELPWPPPVPPATGSGGDELGEQPPDQGNLTGTWKASDGGLIRIVDDGTTIRMELVENPTLRTFTGELTRRKAKSGPQLLTGTVDMVFGEHANRAFHIDVTARFDDPDHLHIRMVDYPYWSGGRVDRKPHSDVWTRSDASSPAASGRRGHDMANPFDDKTGPSRPSGRSGSSRNPRTDKDNPFAH